MLISEDTKLKNLSLNDFVYGDLRSYAVYDNVRSIPSVIDGFKVSQRKCIFGAITNGENVDESPVARIGARIAELSAYHHGEGSLFSTIVGMAQVFVGSNNLNYFEPLGQFGSRLSPEAAAPRYIKTKLSQNFRKISPKDDDIILEYQEEDGEKIEPRYYLPILPNVLVNGARGMGTGYATMALNYNPADLRDYILDLLKKGDSKKELVPWYASFKGKIYRNDKQTVFEGVLEVKNTTTIEIAELPIGFYQADYKQVLNKLEEEGFIKDYDDYSTENEFKFIVTTPRSTTVLDKDELMKKFKLISRETENLTFWTEEGKIKVFEDVYQVIAHFTAHRLVKYEERRLKLIEITEELLRKREERKRFIEFYLANVDGFKNKKKAELFTWLKDNNFVDPDPLLLLPIYSLTRDKIEDLEKEIIEITQKLVNLKEDTDINMFTRELKALKV